MEAQTLLVEDSALGAYEGLAEHYDEFTAGYDYETWLGALEALAFEHGLRGRRLLDVACGTGKSFEPMARRGYEIAACDLSPAMVELAREKAPPGSDLFVADMRELPVSASSTWSPASTTRSTTCSTARGSRPRSAGWPPTSRPAGCWPST